MAVSAATAEFLVEARQLGVRFDRTLTIGRQALFAGPLTLGRILTRHRAWPAGSRRGRELREQLGRAPWLLDPFLETLGARAVVAMDASDYEGADLLHDLNEPVPAELHEQFDVVFDGGCLEHIFDVPQALRSYMAMVAVGGRLIVQTMANNHCGHGFYQFGPELFYRVFSETSGYEVERLQLVVEDVEFARPIAGVRYPFNVGGRRYEVADPAAVGERVQLRTRHGVSLLVQARRVRAAPALAQTVQQSDYTRLWTAQAPRPGAPGPVRTRFRRHAPPGLMMAVSLDLLPRLRALLDPLARRRVARERSLSNDRFYRPVRGRR
jgi:SAM-dependent methyltransferase